LPYWSNPPFLIFDIWALWRSCPERQSAQMSKIKNSGLEKYDAKPFEQQQFGTSGLEWVKSVRMHATYTERYVTYLFTDKMLYLSVFDAFCVVDFPDMLLAGGRDLPNEMEMLRDGVGSVGDDVMLQH